jgi:type I restriction enzyme S subunit
MMNEAPLIPALRFLEFSKKWDAHKLGDFCRFSQGIQIPMSEQIKAPKTGYIRYLYIRDFFTDDFPYYVDDKYSGKTIRESEIMMVNTGNTAGKAFRGKRGILSNNCFKISFDEKNVTSDFLFLAVTSDRIQNWIKRLFNHGGQPHVGHKNIAQVPLAVPTIPEQRKIADFLAAVDGRIGQLIQKKALLEDYKKGVIQQLITQAIRFKNDHGNDFPDWEEKTLQGSLVESRVKGNKGDKARKITVKLWGKGVFSKSDKGSSNTQYYTRSSGQFIYSKLDFLNCAFGIIPPELDAFESTVDLPCFDVVDGSDPRFLLERIKQKNFYKKFGDMADGSRKAKRIHADTFLSFLIHLPHPEEQTKIADFLSAIDRKIESVATQITETQTFKRGLLQQMFV